MKGATNVAPVSAAMRLAASWRASMVGLHCRMRPPYSMMASSFTCGVFWGGAGGGEG